MRGPMNEDKAGPAECGATFELFAQRRDPVVPGFVITCVRPPGHSLEDHGHQADLEGKASDGADSAVAVQTSAVVEWYDDVEVRVQEGR
jgi:hypothetical protein